jgi:hypothetical integral membrane protein (TIGR02206 family)
MDIQQFLHDFWYEKYGFKAFSTEHISIVVGWLILTVALILYARRLPENRALRIGKAIGWTIFGAEAFWLFHKLATHAFDVRYNLPLDLCNIGALAAPFLMMRRHPRLFQILYFWIMTGTLQGVLTPDMQSAFPYIGYLKYWVIHAGLVTGVLYIVFVYRWQPTFRGLGLAFGAIQVYAVVTYGLNLLFNSNYGYLMRKPEGASLFDYFGEHYILVAQGVCLVFFFVFWSPFALVSKKK